MSHKEYFYTKPENISQDYVEIKGAELKHLSRVVRKKVRDIIYVVDGKGNLYTVLLTEIKKQFAIGEIQKRTRFVGEENFQLILAQAVPKGSRFDLVVEKGTELGVSAFIPLLCEHSIVDISPAKISRWRNVAIAAMKQSGRSVLPEISPVQSIKQIIENKNILTPGFIAHQDSGSKSLSRVTQSFKEKGTLTKSTMILIGPEGGFSEAEIQHALENQFVPFSLGQRRLRSETAGVVASAIFMEVMAG
jgi:16S rRNA (uracil1498-N3)-methyltransferase